MYDYNFTTDLTDVHGYTKQTELDLIFLKCVHKMVLEEYLLISNKTRLHLKAAVLQNKPKKSFVTKFSKYLFKYITVTVVRNKKNDILSLFLL